MIAHLAAVVSDFSVYHRIRRIERMEAQVFTALVTQLVHHGGAVAAAARTELTERRTVEPTEESEVVPTEYGVPQWMREKYLSAGEQVSRADDLDAARAAIALMH